MSTCPLLLTSDGSAPFWFDFGGSGALAAPLRNFGLAVALASISQSAPSGQGASLIRRKGVRRARVGGHSPPSPLAPRPALTAFPLRARRPRPARVALPVLAPER